jgi:hypothetical protein
MQGSTIAIIADVALVETRRRAVDLPSSQCSNSFAPTDRVTAEFDSHRLAQTAKLSCDYKNKKRQHSVSAAGISSCSLLFV